MKMSLITILLAAALPYSYSIAQQAQPSRVGTAPVELPASLEKLSATAVMGDKDAAAKLSDYYRYEKNQDPQWKYWALIAAENGDAGSQFDEYNILSAGSDERAQRRALYWLKKSAQGGFSYAVIELKRCFPSGDFESRTRECSIQGDPSVKR